MSGKGGAVINRSGSADKRRKNIYMVHPRKQPYIHSERFGKANHNKKEIINRNATSYNIYVNCHNVKLDMWLTWSEV